MGDSYNHHIMAKAASDAVLDKWRNSTWNNNLVSSKVRATSSSSAFPSPDATFYDEENKRLIAFEFKPPTETKRGMLTAIGQAIAYTEKANLAYIFCPQTVQGFDISTYFKGLFNSKLKSKTPVGLIGYDNDNPSNVSILVDVEKATISNKKVSATQVEDRFWAKHQDMPAQILFYLLDAAFQVGDVDNRLHEVWKSVWLNDILLKGDVVKTLEQLKPHIFHSYGTPYRQLQKTKLDLKKRVVSGIISNDDALKILNDKVNPDLIGDSYANSYKKNFMTFVKHIGLWDDSARLSESGLYLHKLGKLYGFNSTPFIDQLKFEILFSGKHLDLISDIYDFAMGKKFKDSAEMASKFTAHYDKLGRIKWNEKRRQKGGQNEQFKYEFILWRHLGLLSKERSKGGYLPGVGLDINWREITRICSMSVSY